MQHQEPSPTPIDLADCTEGGPVSGPRSGQLKKVESRRVMGKYRIIARIGEGGMAQVHLALMHGSLGFHKLVVIKSMRDHLSDPIFERSFLHEARLAAQLNHPNVVQTYDVGEHEGRPFIAMEFIDGQALRMVQRRLAPERLPLNTQLKILVDVARGLHHAHTARSIDGTPLSIVHRDVSPQNIMVTYDGQVKLLDFGIAKVQGSDELTRDGMIKGKIDYMPPEQLKGEKVDPRTDIFPLGVMLWEAVTGRRFSGGAEVAEITKMHNRLMKLEPRLRDIARDTPMRLVEICDRALSLSPEDRQATAEEFANEIAEYLSETSQSIAPVGEIIAPLFENDRRKLRALMDEQGRAANNEDRSGETGPIELPILMAGDGGTGTPSSNGVLFSAGTGSSTANLRVPPSGSRALPWLAASAVLAVVLVVAQWRIETNASRAEDGAPAAAAAVDPRESAQPPAAAPADATVSVRIESSTEGAVATLDGSPIQLPLTGRLTNDGRIHRLRVAAPGYEPFDRTILLNEDLEIHADLERVAAAVAEPVEQAPTTGARRVYRGQARPAAAAATVMAPAPAARETERAAPVAAAAPEPTSPTPARRPTIVSDDPYR